MPLAYLRYFVLISSLLVAIAAVFILWLNETKELPFISSKKSNEFNCQALKYAQYPIINEEAEGYFQQAYQQANGNGALDYIQIVQLYQQAADLGHWQAMNKLAILYYTGLGVVSDDDKALALIEQMQQYDIPEAYNAMSYAHERGIGRLSKDKNKAKEYLDKSAEFANAESLYRLGYNRVLERDTEAYPEIIKILQCSLGMGYTKSASELALVYELQGRYKDYYDMLIVGANINDTSSLSSLEALFRLGRLGFPKDKLRAKCIQNYKSKFFGVNGRHYQLPSNICTLCPANIELPYGITKG